MPHRDRGVRRVLPQSLTILRSAFIFIGRDDEIAPGLKHCLVARRNLPGGGTGTALHYLAQRRECTSNGVGFSILRKPYEC